MLTKKDWLFTFVSVALTAISLFNLLPWLSIFALVPLLIVLEGKNLRLTFWLSFIYGTACGLGFFFWMVGSSIQFTGHIWYGLLAFIVFALMMGLLNSFLFFLYFKFKSKVNFFLNVFLLAFIFAAGDYAADRIFETMPWFAFHQGNAFTGSIYTIQLAEIGGISILTFFTVLFNGLIAYHILSRKYLKISIAIIMLFLVANAALYNFRNQESGAAVRINLVTHNFDPAVNWEEQGNVLVPQLLQLNKLALLNDAQINLWTESVVPWTYAADDPFVVAILADARGMGKTTLIGLNSESGTGKILDGAYFFNEHNQVTGRYDKQHPLALIERSFFGHVIPMFGNGGFTVEKGLNNKPIRTQYGTIGVMMCNESTIAGSARELVGQGATFLVNMGNDGWFANTNIPRQHFYNNRLRAIENRRDIAVNVNCGYTGMISSSGEFTIFPQAKLSVVQQVSIRNEKTTTIFYLQPFLWLFSVFSGILFILLYEKNSTSRRNALTR